MKRTKQKQLGNILVVCILLIGMCIAIFALKNKQDIRSRATQADVTLILNPTNITGVIDKETPITVLMNTHTKTVSAASINISYDSSVMDIINITLTSALPVVLMNPNNENGTISFSVGSSPDAPVKGVIALANIRIKPRVKQSTPLTFGSATAIAAIESTANVLGEKTGTTIVFAESPTDIPTSVDEYIPNNPTQIQTNPSSENSTFGSFIGSHADTSFTKESLPTLQLSKTERTSKNTGWVEGVTQFFSSIFSFVKILFLSSRS